MLLCLSVLCRGRRLLACLASQRGKVKSRLGQAAGQVSVNRSLSGLLADLTREELGEFAGDFFGRVDVHACRLSRRNQDVVSTHEGGSLNPADQRVSDARARRPTGFVLPLGRNRVEGRLRFAVCTVATEDSAVRRAGKQDVSAVVGSRVCTQAGEQVDCAFDAPQKQAFLSKSTLGIRTNGPGNARRCEGNEKIGKKRGLDDLGRCSVRLGLFATNPGDQRVNIAEGCHVCGDDPQGCADCGVCAVQLLGECQSCIVDSR